MLPTHTHTCISSLLLAPCVPRCHIGLIRCAAQEARSDAGKFSGSEAGGQAQRRSMKGSAENIERQWKSSAKAVEGQGKVVERADPFRPRLVNLRLLVRSCLNDCRRTFQNKCATPAPFPEKTIKPEMVGGGGGGRVCGGVGWWGGGCVCVCVCVLPACPSCLLACLSNSFVKNAGSGPLVPSRCPRTYSASAAAVSLPPSAATRALM